MNLQLLTRDYQWNSREAASGYDSFESFCGQLLMSLELGFPVHLAPGPDRGKDFVLSTLLKGGGRRVFRINVECKFRRNASLGPDALFSKEFWARADKVDLLLIITNARLTAGAADWIRQTNAERPFPIVVWQGEFIDELSRNLLAASDVHCKNKLRLVDRIHKTLVACIADHHKQREAANFDPRLGEDFSFGTLEHSDLFVDRRVEIGILSSFNNYSAAMLTGPVGIGKSMLARQVLQEAKLQGFVPITLSAAHESDFTCSNWLILLAQILQKECGSRELIRTLQAYGAKNLQQCRDVIGRALSKCRLFILVEDVHCLDLDSEPTSLISEICSHLGLSRILVTSRSDEPYTPLLRVPHIKLHLSGFERGAIVDYFNARSIHCPTAVIESLARRHEGWPIIVSEVGSCLAVEGPKARLRDLLNRIKESVGPVLARSALSRVSPSAQRLLSFLVCLRTPLSWAELSVLLGPCEEDWSEVRNELARAGVINPHAQPIKSVHDMLRVQLREVLCSTGDVDREIGIFLRSGAENPERLVAATEHFLRVPDQEEAAKTLYLNGETLLRCGMADTLLKIVAKIDPALISERSFLPLVLLQVGSLEMLGRISEATDALLTFFHPEAFASLDPWITAQFFYRRARIRYLRGDYAGATSDAENVLIMQEAEHDRDFLLTRVRCLALCARIHYIRRDLAAAEEAYKSALAQFSDLADRLGANKARHRLAMIDFLRGNLEAALSNLRAVQRESKRLNDFKRLSYALHRLGQIEAQRGNTEEARKYFQESIKIKKKIGHVRGLLYGNIGLAELYLLEGKLDIADAHARRALEYAGRLEMPKEEALISRLLGKLRYRQGKSEEGDLWYRQAETAFSKLELPKRAKAVQKERAEEAKRFKIN